MLGNGVLVVDSSRSACSTSRLHSGSGIASIRSVPMGRGVAHDQWAPIPPTLLECAAAGIPPASPSTACVPGRTAVRTSTEGGPCDRRRMPSRSTGSSTFRTFIPATRVSRGPSSTISIRAAGARPIRPWRTSRRPGRCRRSRHRSRAHSGPRPQPPRTSRAAAADSAGRSSELTRSICSIACPCGTPGRRG